MRGLVGTRMWLYDFGSIPTSSTYAWPCGYAYVFMILDRFQRVVHISINNDNEFILHNFIQFTVVGGVFFLSNYICSNLSMSTLYTLYINRYFR